MKPYHIFSICLILLTSNACKKKKNSVEDNDSTNRTPVVVFHETFSNGFTSNWTIDTPGNGQPYGIPMIDNTDGFPSPCLLFDTTLHTTNILSNINPINVSEGITIDIGVKIQQFDTTKNDNGFMVFIDPFTSTSPNLETRQASLSIGNEDKFVSKERYLFLSGYGIAGSNNRSLIKDNYWHHYVFKIFPDGKAQWLRDGVIQCQIENFSLTTELSIGFRSYGKGGSNSGILGHIAKIDEIKITKP